MTWEEINTLISGSWTIRQEELEGGKALWLLENPRWALGVVPGWCCGSLFLFFFYSAVRVRHSVSSSHLFFSFQPPSFFSVPSSIPPIPIRILFPFANPQYVSGPSSTPLGDAKGKSRPKERHRTGPELSTLIHSDSVPPSRYLLPCFCLSDCLGKRIWNHGRGREGGRAKMEKGEGEF